MLDSGTSTTLNFMGNSLHFEADFWKYNETRRIQEEKSFEIISRYFSINGNLTREYKTLVKSEIDKFNSSIEKINTLDAVLERGMLVLEDFVNPGLAEIVRRLIFKYTSHDEMTTQEIGSTLITNPNAQYAALYNSFYNKLEQSFIQADEMDRAVKNKHEAMHQRQTPHVSGGGIGFKGAMYGAMGAAATNIGWGILQGISDGLEYSSDDSKLKEAKLSGVVRAKNDIVYMGQEELRYALEFCKKILETDMQHEIDELGIIEYRTYPAQDAEKIKLRNENYDEAYREGDIDEKRYVPHLFCAIGEVPYDIKQYMNFYLVAARIGDNDLKVQIMQFAAALGLDKLLDFMLDRESAAQIEKNKVIPERTKEDVEQKIQQTKHLYGKSAKKEIDRLNEKIEYFKEIAKTQADYAKLQKHISAGNDISAYINPNGTVSIIGTDEEGAFKVKHFKNIKAISSRCKLTIGLCEDGTVVSSGSLLHRANIQGWKDITDISMGAMHCAGIQKGGTVLGAKVSGYKDDIDYGQLNVSAWRNIVYIACGPYYTVGVKENGTVVFAGYFGSGGVGLRPSQEVLQKISTWTNISTVAAGVDHILGLKKDGTVVAVGDNSEHQCEVEAWNDVVAIAAGRAHSIGLRFDGKVYGAGADNVHQRNVANWKDIVAIAATYDHTIGMKTDATLVAAGPAYAKHVHVQQAIVSADI